MKTTALFLFFSFLFLFSLQTEAANRYWIATSTANWNSTANWSTTSGGSGGASVPGSSDIAIFNNVRVGSCTINATVNVAGISIVSGYTGTISQGTYSVTVGSSNYSQAAGTFTGGSGTIDINGTFSLSGGTFTSTSGNFSTGGTFAANATLFSHTGGTFNHNNGTYIVDPIGSFTYTIKPTTTTAFYSSTINAAGTIVLFNSTDTLRINNALTMQAATFNTGTISVKGNATVTGLFGGTGVVAFTGTNDQTFTLTSHTDKFNAGLNVKLSPGKKLTLTSAATFDNLFQTITLTRGIVVTTATNLLTMGHATILSGGSNASYIEGPVKKIGNAAFTFPTGRNGYFRKISISAPTNSTDAYTAEYFEGNSSLINPHTSKDAAINQLSRNEYWNLTRNAGITNVSITLSWDVPPSCSFSNVANMKVCGWDGSNWKDRGNGGTTGTTTSGTVVSSAVVSVFGMFTLGSSSTFTCYDNVSSITLDSLVKYGMLAGDTVRTIPAINVTGRVGAVKAITGTIYASDGKYANNTGNVPNAMTTLGNLITNINGRYGLPLSTLNDISLAKGVYRSNGNSELNGRITLTGTSSDVYIFKVSGNLTIRSHSVIDIGDVLPHKVYWLASGNIIIEDSVEVSGIFISQQNLNVFNDNIGTFGLWASGDIAISGNSGIISSNSFYSYNGMDVLRGGNNFASELTCGWISTGGSSGANDGNIYPPAFNGFEQDICIDQQGGNYYMGFTCNGINCNVNDYNSSSAISNDVASDAILIKYNSGGDIQWIRNGNPDDGGFVTCKSITFEKVGGTEYVYMAGEFHGTADFGSGSSITSSGSGTLDDYYIAVYTSAGTFVRLIHDGASSTDPTYTLKLNDIDVDPSFNIYICGTAATTINGIAVGGTMYVVSYNNSGAHRWAQYGSTPKSLYTPGLVYSSTSGKVHVAGTYSGPSTTFDDFTYTGGGIVLNGEDAPINNIFYLSITTSTGVATAISISGNDLTKDLIFHDISVNETTGDVYVLGKNYMTCCSSDPDYPLDRSFYLVNGASPVAINHTNGVVNYNGIGAYGSPADVFVTGEYSGTTIIDGNYYTSFSNLNDIIIRKLAANPSNNFVKTFGSEGEDKGIKITANSCKVYSTGVYNDQANFESEYFDSQGSSDVFALQTSAAPLSVTITHAGTPAVCTGQTILLDAGSGYTSYLWSTGATTQTITVGAGTYSVIVSTSCCGNITDDIVIANSGNCCFIPWQPNYDNYTATSQLANFTGGSFSINHLFTVNANITFSGCTVKLGKDARILVKAGKTLTITNNGATKSYLSSCDEMWDGIYLEMGSPGGNVVINNSSIIEDAYFGVREFDGGTMTINNAIFNKNFYHIYINHIGASNAPGTIINSQFLCQTAWNNSTPASLRPPLSAYKTYMGVYGNGIAFSFSVGGSNTGNTFDNSLYGIYATNNTNNTLFQDNIMTDIDINGIYVKRCSRTLNIDILDNDLSRLPTGIFCYDDPEAEIKIDNNTIDLGGMTNPPQHRYGITVQEIAGGTTSEVRITGNTVLNAPTGIWALDLTGEMDLANFTGSLYIGDNYITHTKIPNDVQAGILVQNCLGALIVDNEVRQPTGETTPDWWKTGIRQELGNTNFIFCNNTHDVGYGMMISGDARPFELVVKNKMQNNVTGIFLNGARVGDQGSSSNPHDNEWLGTWTGTNYTTLTYQFFTDPPLNRFWVRNTYPFFPGNNTFGGGATGPIILPTPYPTTPWSGGDCPYFVAPSYKTDEIGINGNEEQIINMLNEVPVLETVLDTSLDWMGKYGLYKNLVLHPDLMTRDEIHNFFNGRFNGNTGKIERAIRDYDSYRANNGQGQNGNSAFGHYQALQHLTPANKVESNLKSTLGIFYTNIIEERGLNETEILTLRGIAELCPYTDGFGVYMARTALVEVDTLPKIYYTECEAKLSPGSDKWEGAEDVSNELNFRLYPNPNQGNMVLEYQLNEGETSEFELYDLLGSLVYRQGLLGNSGITPVSISNISSGAYFATVKVNGEIRFKEKLTIIR